MRPEAMPVDVCAPDIAGPRHACAFFDGPEDEYRVLSPFAQQCARCGERCFQFFDPAHKAERISVLEKSGADVAAIRDGMRGWDETYLRGGRFVIAEMLQFAHEILDRSNGAPRARVWGNMEWAGRELSRERDLVEYESRLNAVIEQGDGIVVCAYRSARHSPEVALGVLQVHPWILVGSRLEPNPAYVGPSDRIRQ
jgi:hypothetical protein